MAVSRVGTYVAALLSLLTISAAFAATATASTAVTENITTDTTWTKAGSPYEIDKPGFQVANGATLTVEPGVFVVFPGEYNQTLTVYGTDQGERDCG